MTASSQKRTLQMIASAVDGGMHFSHFWVSVPKIMRRVILSLLLSSVINLAILIVWESSRPLTEYDWKVGSLLTLGLLLLAIIGFSSLGLLIALPIIQFLRQRKLSSLAVSLTSLVAGAIVGYLLLVWTPEGAIFGAAAGAVTVGCLRVLAPPWFNPKRLRQQYPESGH